MREMQLSRANLLMSYSGLSAWQSSLQEKEIALANDLKAGYWNPVAIDLIPCNSDALGYLEISTQIPNIILHVHPEQ
jgi:hypothetical protein